MEGDLEWNKTYFYYDTLARLIATHRYHSDGGYTKSEALLNFNGDPSLSYTRHKKSPTEAEMVLKDRYLYDTKARLTHHYHTVNSLAEELLSFTQYDQVGRMKQKAVGGSLSAPLQTLNYAYHIRGSLKALNDPSNLGSDLFGYRLYFEDPAPSTGAATKYNGSISQMDWATKAQSPSVLRRYSFSYDGLDRLLGAYYLKPGASDTATGAYNELLSYDKNGNIKTLSRYGGKDSTPARKTDALTYTYSGGKLTKVVNAISDPLGYPPGGAALGYNSSGELISHPDKGLSLIEYNSMGLPSSFTKGALTTTYRYLADGVRLEKIQGQKRSLKLGDFHYETTSGGLTLQFVPTSEGYYDFIKNAYIYNYVDHLGNIRVSYYKNSAGALLVLEENHYYPFGQKHEGYGSATTATPSYQYKFGSKELQDTGFYDFGARFYMPDIGRWMSVDPLAEEFPGWNPYHYVHNNPINMVDPTGMAAEHIDVTKNEDGTYKVVGGQANTDKNIYVVDGNGKRTGEVVGEMLTEYSFHHEDGSAVIGANINLNDQSGQNFMDNEIKNIGLIDYISNAKGKEPLDFKHRGMPKGATPEEQGQHHYRGMSFNGKVASARDIGNYAAGYVAGKHGFDWGSSRFAFDALQTKQEKGTWNTVLYYQFNRVREGQPTQQAERAGHNTGYSIFKQRQFERQWQKATTPLPIGPKW